MNALSLGLIAAFCWAFHDICVRFLSQKTPISACITVVLVTGLIFHLGLMGVTAEFTAIPAPAVWPAIWSGVFFVIATLGLYTAFQRGPVRLVAPIIASYPILSVAIARWQGEVITPLQWLAILGIAVGVGIVAALAEDSDENVPAKGPTILFATISAIGFAGTFATGQHAAELGGEMGTTLVTRCIAVGLIIVLFLGTRQVLWPGMRALPVLIAMGVADGIALLCVLSAGTLPNPQYAAVTSSMFGLLTIVLAWALLKERMTPTQWVGCTVAFCGVGYLAL